MHHMPEAKASLSHRKQLVVTLSAITSYNEKLLCKRCTISIRFDCVIGDLTVAVESINLGEIVHKSRAGPGMILIVPYSPVLGCLKWP